MPEAVAPNTDNSLAEESWSEHVGEQEQAEQLPQGLQPAQPATQSLACPRCHQKNAPDADFCFACGLPIGDSDVSAKLFNATETVDAISPAGFWIRVGAYLVDIIIVFAIWFGAVLTYATYLITTTGDDLLDFVDSPFFSLLLILLMLIYHTLLVGLWSTTVGKRLFGLYVLQSDGSRVGFGRALARNLASYISGLILNIGYLLVAFHKDKLSLHDLICGTKVVKRTNRPRGL